MGTGTFLLTCTHTRTRGTGLHTRHSFPPSIRDNDDATMMVPRPRPVLTAHPHMQRRQCLANPSSPPTRTSPSLPHMRQQRRDDNDSASPSPSSPLSLPLPPCDDDVVMCPDDATTTSTRQRRQCAPAISLLLPRPNDDNDNAYALSSRTSGEDW